MTDSPLDYKVKKNLLKDSLKILNLSWPRKNRYINNSRVELQRRLTGKQRMNMQEKELAKAKK